MSVLNLRLPANLHEELKSLAEQQGVSMNQLALLALAEKLAVLRWQELATRREGHEAGLEILQKRATRGSRERFLEALDKAGDNPPRRGDELPSGYTTPASAPPDSVLHSDGK